MTKFLQQCWLGSKRLSKVDNGLAMVLAALVAAVGGVIVAFIQGLRKENREDHAVVQSALQHIYRVTTRTEDKVDSVKSELNRHLLSHNEGDSGKSTRRDTAQRK